MKTIMFGVGHPGHVHLFRNAISILNKKGYKVCVGAINKEVSFSLLDSYGIEYTKLGDTQKGIIRKGLSYPRFVIQYLRLLKENHVDLSVSAGSPYLAIASYLCGIPHYAFIDSEPPKFVTGLLLPFTKKIFTPSCFKRDLGRKQVRYNGFHELAYLHPNYFHPDETVLTQLKVKRGEPYFLLRFVSWQASHDVGRLGLTLKNKVELVTELNKHGRIFISSEQPLPPELMKYKLRLNSERLHDALNYASLVITEGATIATEAAILGTPSIFINPLAPRLGNFLEMEKKYGLINSFSSFSLARPKIKEFLKRKNLKSVWLKKRNALLNDKIDVTEWMVREIENIND